jgi:hypothetical protein
MSVIELTSQQFIMPKVTLALFGYLEYILIASFSISTLGKTAPQPPQQLLNTCKLQLPLVLILSSAAVSLFGFFENDVKNIV